MHPYVIPLKELFEQNAHPALAGPMVAYMRNQFAYLGIKTPQSAILQKQYYAEHGLPALAELDPILRDLWALPQREFQYVAVGLIGILAKKLPPEFTETLEFLIVTKSWWDTIDSIAAGTVAIHFQRYPNVFAPKPSPAGAHLKTSGCGGHASCSN